ncbi:MAG TPA: metalloregulator ArsR/SmtB family transcription factor [Thermomicrobiales bacterium]|nr:metalloregulator ArsR/SmtB family transcription factor [Thermomicrobiales bacterium]
MARRSIRIQPEGCCTPPLRSPAPVEGGSEAIVSRFKALADATRFEIFRLVAAQDAPVCACDIVDRFEVSQPTIAHHMKVLERAGLITVSRQGVWAYYAVDPRGLEAIGVVMSGLMPAGLPASSVVR